MPVIAGLLPITNVKQLERMALLSGTPIPTDISERINQVEGNPQAIRKEGVAIAAELSIDLLNAGAPGLHYYTMNSAESTTEIVKRFGLR